MSLTSDGSLKVVLFLPSNSPTIPSFNHLGVILQSRRSGFFCFLVPRWCHKLKRLQKRGAYISSFKYAAERFDNSNGFGPNDVIASVYKLAAPEKSPALNNRFPCVSAC
jgi:hypothetical protein